MTTATEVFADENRTVERKMTKTELDEIAQIHDEIQTAKQVLLDREAARQSALAKLAALGLTQAEIEAL